MAKMGSDSLGRRARRQFSDEFRAGAVRLVLDEGKTIGAVARELDSDAVGAGRVGPTRASRSDQGAHRADERRAHRVGGPAQRQS